MSNTCGTIFNSGAQCDTVIPGETPRLKDNPNPGPIDKSRSAGLSSFVEAIPPGAGAAPKPPLKIAAGALFQAHPPFVKPFASILALPSSFGFLLALHRRLFVMLSFAVLRKHTVLRAGSLETLQRSVQRFVLSYMNFSHLCFPSLCQKAEDNSPSHFPRDFKSIYQRRSAAAPGNSKIINTLHYSPLQAPCQALFSQNFCGYITNR